MQSLSRVQLFATQWTAALQASLSFTISRSLLKFMFIEYVMPSNHLILYCPLLLLPSIFPSIRVFPSESVLCIRWPKNWSFNFCISPSSEYSELISFRIDWFDLLADQGTLKSLLQHHSSKALILWHTAFFMVQFSHPYMTIGKTLALTIWNFVGKVMSLLLNILSRFVRAFLPRSKHLLISWLHPPSAVTLEPKKDKVRDVNIRMVLVEFSRKQILRFSVYKVIMNAFQSTPVEGKRREKSQAEKEVELKFKIIRRVLRIE